MLPDFAPDEAAAAAKRLFGLDGPIKLLDGERDLNFLIGESGARHVFKIANLLEDPAMLECQHEVFERLEQARVFPAVATALASRDGNAIETLRSRGGDVHVCRVLPFIEGRLLADIDAYSEPLLEDIGANLARLDLALDGYSHPALERPLLWKMDNALDVLADFKPLLKDGLELVEYFEAGYRDRVSPKLGELRRAVIHNDANRGNLLIDADGERLLCVIDFGDMVNSWLVIEPVIAATYVMLDQADPLTPAASLLRGYHAVYPLTAVEQDLVFDFICMRLCTSVCINAHQAILAPENEYLNVDVASCWELLRRFRDIDPADARAALAA